MKSDLFSGSSNDFVVKRMEKLDIEVFLDFSIYPYFFISGEQ